MKNSDYYNQEDFADYYGYSQRHKRAVDELNGDKPGISPRLRKIVWISLGVGLIVLIGKVFG